MFSNTLFSLELFCLALPGQSFIHSQIFLSFVYVQGILQGCEKNSKRNHTWVLPSKSLQSNRKGKTGIKNTIIKVENSVRERK